MLVYFLNLDGFVVSHESTKTTDKCYILAEGADYSRKAKHNVFLSEEEAEISIVNYFLNLFENNKYVKSKEMMIDYITSTEKKKINWMKMYYYQYSRFKNEEALMKALSYLDKYPEHLI